MSTTPLPDQTFNAAGPYPNTCTRCGYRREQHTGPELACRDSGMRWKHGIRPAPPAEEAFPPAPDAVFPALRVQVRGDVVESSTTGAPLGPVAGAEARLTDGSQAWSPGRAAFMPLALAGLATKTKATAFVIFADGTCAETALNGNAAVREAQADAVRFNLLTGKHAPPAEPAAPQEQDVGATLRTLASLHDEGLLTDDEYAAKRAEVIARI